MKNNNKGFSLVELIVVIAIMAILAAVAVVGFSVYIPKAQQAGDRQTVNEVIDGIELYYYSTPEMEKGYIKLTQTGVEADATGAAVMEAIYGADWATKVSLQYADWQGTTAQVAYANSSYAGKEGSLLNEVDRLTGALGDVVGNIDANVAIGENFNEFLGGYGLTANSDPTSIGNAAVLYVAKNTASSGDAIQNAFQTHMTVDNPNLGGVYADLMANPNVGSAAALAAIYAYAEGFAQYCDQVDPSLDAVSQFHEAAVFDEVTNPSTAFDVINSAFGTLGQIGNDHVGNYIQNQGMANIAGYVGIMGTVNDNKDIVENKLSSDNCFTDGEIESLLHGYTEMGKMEVSTQNGEIAIVFVVVDGAVTTYVYPLNWEE